MEQDPMLKKTIHFWEVILKDKFLISPSTQVFIELTVKYLKELKEFYQE